VNVDSIEISEHGGVRYSWEVFCGDVCHWWGR